MDGMRRLALISAIGLFAGLGCGEDDRSGVTGGAGGGATGGSGGSPGTGGSAGGTGGSATTGGMGGGASGGMGGGASGGMGGGGTGGGGTGGGATGGTGGMAMGGAGGTPAACAGGSLLPLKIGNKWTYRVTEPVGAPYMKTNEVVRMEPIPVAGPHKDKMALRVETKKGASDLTVSWQAVEGSKVIRFAETSYAASTMMVDMTEHWSPPKLRIDDTKTMKGQTWNEMYTEVKLPTGGVMTSTAQTDIWTVSNTGVACGPVKGMMYTCVEFKKAGSSTDAGKTYLYAPCVGKVRELGRPGFGQNEDLMDFTIVP